MSSQSPNASGKPAHDPRPGPPSAYLALQTVEAPLGSLLGLSCRHFAELSVVKFERPLTLSERLRHNVHRSMCRLCRRFSAQFQSLAELSKDLDHCEPVGAPVEKDSVDRVNAAVRAAVEK